MNILAIETSCDETAVAVVRDGRHILANVVASQVDLHARYGGVVPELASRQHILALVPTLEEAFARSGLTWDEIDAVAVTRGPGLAGALLVGLNAAKAIAFAREKPLVAVNHLEAHIYSNWIAPTAPRPDVDRTEPTEPAFPLICLVVSGGHTELVYIQDHGVYTILGKTVDDAAGEAFDKVARILGLPYPGGPSIQQAAEGGDPKAIDLPRAALRGSYDFSFSGLKTAVLRRVRESGDGGRETGVGSKDLATAHGADFTAEALRRGEPEGATNREETKERSNEDSSDKELSVESELAQDLTEEAFAAPRILGESKEGVIGLPRVLGEGEEEAVAPPPFLAGRLAAPAPTPLRREPDAPSQPETPAFLRARRSGDRAREAGDGRRESGVSEEQAGSGQPEHSEERKGIQQRSGAGSQRPVEKQPTGDRATEQPVPHPPPANPPTQNSKLKAQSPVPHPPSPVSRPPVLRAVPKSAQVGRARKAEDMDDVDTALDKLLGDEDEDLGTDDEPLRPGGGSIGLEGPRSPEARLPVERDGDTGGKSGKPHPERAKPPLPVADFAASFQDAAVEMLVEKTVTAAAAYKVRTVLLAGGVAANLRLRERLRERLGDEITLLYPPPSLCTDNAAMVAAAAYFRDDSGLQHDWSLDIDPNAGYA